MLKLIVFTIFSGFGGVLLYVGITQFFQQRRLLANAVPIEARIIHSQVFSSQSQDTDRRVNRSTSTTSYRPDVRFSYQVDGVTYESDLLYPNIIVRGYGSHDGAAEALMPFPVGATVPAFVDPAEPDKAFLIKEKAAGPMVFMIVGVLIPPIMWFVVKLL